MERDEQWDESKVKKMDQRNVINNYRNITDSDDLSDRDRSGYSDSSWDSGRDRSNASNTYFDWASACIKINSHFRENIFCSRAKFSAS